MFHSPLAEKRLAISLAKKHLVGRRAYSDSIYMTKSPKHPPSSSSSSERSSPVPSPVPFSVEHLQAPQYFVVSDLQDKAFGGIHAC